MKTLVIGANGKIGQRVVAKLAGAGQPVRAMVRSQEQRPALENLGAEVVLGDLEEDFTQALGECGAVVFTAGSGGHTGADKTVAVDLWGAVKSIRACAALGLQRYVMISARNAGNPDSGPASRRHYLVAKHIADDYLMSSGLDYTILRPGKLTEDPGTGLVRTTRPESDEEQFISRDDLAEAVVFCLRRQAASGLTTQLYQGETPIERALAD